MRKIFNCLFIAMFIVLGAFINSEKVFALESGFHIDCEAKATQVNVSWESDITPEKYGLFVQEENGSFMPISYGMDFTHETKGEILNLKPNTKYKVSVTAYLDDSNYIFSEPVEITTGDAIRFESSSQGTTMNFTWDKDEEAGSYNIYKVKSYYCENGEPRNFELIANLNNNQTNFSIKKATKEDFESKFVLEVIKKDSTNVKSNFTEPKTFFLENKMNISGLINKKYNTRAQTQTIKVIYNGKELKNGKDYTISYKNNINVGTAIVSISGKGDYAGIINRTFKINKATNPAAIKAVNKKVKYKKVKKKKQVIAPITVTKAQGTVTYAKVSGNKKIKVDKKTGKITVKKKTKKGTYYVKVKITASGNKNYKALTKTVTIAIKVK